MSRLKPDAPSPELSVSVTGGGSWTLNAPAPEHFTLLVFYRGYHCPVCKSYLQTLTRLLPTYRAAGFDVIAVSMDDAERAEKSVVEWELGDLPIGYGLAREQAEAWGLYLSRGLRETETSVFCEPGLFWVRPDGRLYLAATSNMPWARPDLEFLASKIPFAVKNGYPARGTLD